MNPLLPFLEKDGLLILDGGLATELERRGHDLSDALWSARLLLDAPEAIRQLHVDYLEAGADCIISASYQASLPAFLARGLSLEQAEAALRLSVRLTLEARDQFWRRPARLAGRRRPIVAARVGPYGAYLADGSEYTGGYRLDEAGLLAFHAPRWAVLAAAGADILACETIPSAAEARALGRLLADSPGVYAWFSFSCRDECHISDGTPLREALAPLDDLPGVAAVGVNCTSPAFIPALIAEARRASAKPILVYPNSGERYRAAERAWRGAATAADFAAASRKWRAAGAAIIGGCCRTGPEHIRQIRRQLVQES
ncbi:MAG: homocysteine S-methyltransferase [Candidatus Promineifilaceae bacterium]